MPNVAGKPYYFASWTGYEPPVRPHNPIVYEDAEASRAFTVFVFDEQGWVATFVKWLATATTRELSLVAGRSLEPGRSFFEAAAKDGAVHPGRPLSLDDTRDANEYFRVRASADGSAAAVEHVRRERTIFHEYRYWEDGSLREYRFTSPSGLGGVKYFDRSGNLVNSGRN
jgi:hypothetical protein